MKNEKSLEGWYNMQYFWKINLSPEWDDIVTCQPTVGPLPKALIFKPLLWFSQFLHREKEAAMHYCIDFEEVQNLMEA